MNSRASHHSHDVGLVVLTCVLAILQLAWLTWSGASTVSRFIAAFLVLTAIWLVLTRSRPESSRPMIVVLASGVAANLTLAALGFESPVPGRILALVLLFACLAVSLGTVFALRREKTVGSIATVAVLLGPVVIGEVILSAVPPPLFVEPAGDFARAPRPEDAQAYAPLSVIRVPYASDLGGYLDASYTSDIPWDVTLSDSANSARLVHADSDSIVRVEIERTSGDRAWAIQLVQTPHRIVKDQSYRLSFLVRSDGRRTLEAMVNLGGDPWLPLGYSETLTTDTVWQRISRTFVASESDSAAWLRFNLGASDTDVALRDVILHETGGSGTDSTVTYSLPYEFDNLGCRGPVRALGADSSVVRILVLGDSYTLGAGVRGGDAWPSRLESVLNTGNLPDGIRETAVYNCAVTGAGTAIASERFAVLAADIRPSLVLLGTVLGDERRSSDDITIPIVGQRHVDRLLRLPGWWRARTANSAQLESTRAGLPVILREVTGLDSAVRSANAKFAVLVIQDHASASWSALTSALTDSTLLPGVPVLNLGDRIRIFGVRDRYVQPSVDMHLSRTVHRSVAEAAAAFIRQHALLVRDDSLPATSRVP